MTNCQQCPFPLEHRIDLMRLHLWYAMRYQQWKLMSATHWLSMRRLNSVFVRLAIVYRDKKKIFIHFFFASKNIISISFLLRVCTGLKEIFCFVDNKTEFWKRNFNELVKSTVIIFHFGFFSSAHEKTCVVIVECVTHGNTV